MGGKLPPIAFCESDNSPKVYQPWEVIFPNGTLTDVGDGRVLVGIGTSIETTTSITVSTLDARTPVLLAGTVLYMQTDGDVTHFMAGDGRMLTPIEARSPLLKNASIMSIITDSTYILAASPLLKSGTIFSIQTDATYIIAASPLLKYGTMLTVQTDGGTTTYLRGDGTYRSVLEARTPLLFAGTVLSINTDGSVTTYLSGDGVFRTPVEARSPLLKNASVMSVQTDGSTTSYFRGDGTYSVPASNSGIKMAVFTLGSDDSWDSEAIPVFEAPYDTSITFKQMNFTVMGAGTITFNLEERPYGGLASAGTSIFAANRSATQTGFETTTFASSVMGGKNHLVFVTSPTAVAGQVDLITGVIYYKRDSI